MAGLSRFVAAAATLVVGSGVAHAQFSKIPIPGITTGTSATDWATCPADLPQCTETVTSCCYRTFDPGSIVVPMDRCHQALDVSKLGPVVNDAMPTFCADPNSTMDGRSADMGMFEAYGLVYRLMQAGIPIYWIVNPTKMPPMNKKGSEDSYTRKDIDFWVLSPGMTAPPTAGSLTACGAGCTDPVKLLNKTSLAAIDDTYNRKEFPVRGGFVIAAQDRTRFDAFWKKTGEFASLSGNAVYSFSTVDLYEIQASGSTPARVVYQDMRQTTPTVAANGASAPVGQKISYRAPRLARFGPANVSTHWLDVAKLQYEAAYPQCLDASNTWASTAVFCSLTEADIKAGKLITGKFDWAWIDQGNSYDAAFATAVTNFVTATSSRPGGSVLFEGDPADAYDTYIATTGTNNQGSALGESMIIRYPQNLISQISDLVPEFEAGGSIGYWDYYGGGATGYKSAAAGTASPAVAGTMHRLFTQEASASTNNPLCTNHRSTETCDIFANAAGADTGDTGVYWRYNNVADNGVLFYMGGRNPQSAQGQLRVLLNSLIAIPSGTVLQTVATTKQIARSTPTLAVIGTTALTSFQGSMKVTIPLPTATAYAGSASNTTFVFPFITGHVHAIAVSALSTAGSTDFADSTAMESFPSVTASGCGTLAFSGQCRTVFTNTTTGKAPAIVQFSTANRSALKPLIGSTLADADADVLIGRVLAGVPNGTTYVPKLGGVDRSTIAVVEPSPNANASRPTMIYVGALDGMLHALCAEAKAGTPCTAAGRELWAYIPRTQLGRLKTNTARVDGSPKVADVMVSGHWATVIVFQTGAGSPAVYADAPAAVALDVTNPAAPTILWERTTPATRGSVEQGVGVGVAIGPIATTSYAFLETSNGGTGTAGVVVDAIDLATGNTTTGAVGAPAWRWSSLYPAPRTSGNSPVPATAIPPGVSLADTNHDGKVGKILVPTLYGQVYQLDPATGTNANGSNALLSFSTDFHPIGAPVSLYRTQADGTMYALAVSGGYDDPVSTTWSPNTVHQYAVAFTIQPPAGTTLPIIDTGYLSLSLRPFVYDLGVVNRAFGQAVIAGGEIFIATDTADENAVDYGFATESTGKLHRLSISGSVIGTTTLGDGASGVDVSSDGRVVIGAGAGERRVDSAGFNATGVAVELIAPAAMKRRFWLAD